jgi:pimeloyl-ACP methyl ester carboxylesterase
VTAWRTPRSRPGQQRGRGTTRGQEAATIQPAACCCRHSSIGLQLALDDPGLVASLILFEPAKPSGTQREVAASTYVGPALAAAAQGDIARAFDVFLRGVGGDGYREALRARLGDDGLVQAEHESAYFFAAELPALAAWTFGPAEAARVTAPALLLCGAESRPWFRETSPSWPRCCPTRARKPCPSWITSPRSPAPPTSPPPSAPSSATQQPRPPGRHQPA